jgi:hypothetical protein
MCRFPARGIMHARAAAETKILRFFRFKNMNAELVELMCRYTSLEHLVIELVSAQDSRNAIFEKALLRADLTRQKNREEIDALPVTDEVKEATRKYNDKVFSYSRDCLLEMQKVCQIDSNPLGVSSPDTGDTQ